MDKKIVVIAGMIFAVAFIGVMSALVTNVNNYGTNTSMEMGLNNKSMIRSELTPYDGKQVLGDTIISIINNKSTLADGTKLAIYILNGTTVKARYGYVPSYNPTITKENINGIETYYTSTMGTSMVYYQSNATGDAKITSVKNYTGHILYNSNGAIIGLVFVI